MTEILLLGTFHFTESGIDFFTEDSQKELDRLVKKIAAFAPDAVAVEYAAHQQSAIDVGYSRLRLSDFDDYGKMKTETLGSITMFGETNPITYKNESVQIGYRLGKTLGLEKVFGIDEDIEMDGALFENPKPNLQAAIKAFADCSRGRGGHITEQLESVNSDEWSRTNHNVYMAVNAINDDNSYNGSMTVLKWYERNLKIFANIQRIAQNAERIFVLYGAGHLRILKDLINGTEGMKTVDVSEYLR